MAVGETEGPYRRVVRLRAARLRFLREQREIQRAANEKGGAYVRTAVLAKPLPLLCQHARFYFVYSSATADGHGRGVIDERRCHRRSGWHRGWQDPPRTPRVRGALRTTHPPLRWHLPAWSSVMPKREEEEDADDGAEEEGAPVLVAPIAVPLADAKTAKKVLKVVKRGTCAHGRGGEAVSQT